MEALRILEEKVRMLIKSRKDDLETIARLRDEKAQLELDNKQLATKINVLEESLLSHDKDNEKLDEEREMTKLVVDELIQHIDVLEKELQA
ncbi:MAG: hypothetical protein JW725_00450 [Candidatus Babeliaceae bacterium]|nr:hypothetical protein [Candidatus Babeliaceae bacterium]